MAFYKPARDANYWRILTWQWHQSDEAVHVTFGGFRSEEDWRSGHRPVRRWLVEIDEPEIAAFGLEPGSLTVADLYGMIKAHAAAHEDDWMHGATDC